MANDRKVARTKLILAIESSTDWLSVALLCGEEVLSFEEIADGRQHASALLPTIDSILTRTAVGLGDLDAIGIATGPGSFTSLRIGLATVKGLAFGRSLQSIGVSTLEAMALSLLDQNEQGEGYDVVSLLDARRGEWYAGAWSGLDEPGGVPVATLPEGLYGPSQLAEDLGAAAILISPEEPGWQSNFAAAGVEIRSVVDGRDARPRADWVGRLAHRRLERGEGADVSTLEARYLRRAEAEAKRLGGPVEEGELARLKSTGRR